MANTKYFSHIDGLRAISVLLVILFHYGIGPFSGGYIGVDVFFTISGFLIIGSIVDLQEKISFSLTDFWQRRIRRLLPAIMTTLVACLVAGFMLMTPQDFEFLARQALLGLFSAINFSLLGETDYFALEQSTDPLLHLWSLAVEEQFYIVFPLLAVLICAKFADKHSVRQRILYILMVLSIVSLFASQWLVSVGSQLTAYYMMPTRFSQLALGGALSLFLGSASGQRLFDSRTKGFHTVAVMLGMALVAYGAILFHDETPFPGYRSLLPTVAAMLILLSGARSLLSQVFENPVSTYIGKLSFSLYLVHWPVWIFLTYYRDHQLNGLETVLAIIITFVLSATMYHGIETPVRFSQRFSGSGMYRLILPSIVVVLVSSTAIMIADGFPTRISADRQEIAVDAKNFHRNHYGGTGYRGNFVHHLGHPDARPDFLLIGDSKARQFAIGLHEALTLRNRAALLINHDGCAFVLGAVRIDKGNLMGDCYAMTERALMLAGQHDTPVIYATSWGNSSYLRHHQDLSGKEVQVSPEQVAEFRADLTLEYIESLRAQLRPGTPIYLLGDNAGFDGSQPIVNCLTRPDWLGLPCTRAKEFAAMTYTIPTVERLLLAQLPSDVHFIPMVDVFCPGGVCRQVSTDGQIVFSDPSHLSEWGSRQLSPVLLEKVGLAHFSSEDLGPVLSVADLQAEIIQVDFMQDEKKLDKYLERYIKGSTEAQRREFVTGLWSGNGAFKRNRALGFAVAKYIADKVQDASSVYIAGFALYLGKGTGRDRSASMRYMNHPSLSSNHEVSYRRATVYLDQGLQDYDPELGLKLLMQAAAEGVEPAEVLLSTFQETQN